MKETLESLQRWKEEMLQVDAQCDWQELARLLEMTPGQDIRRNIIPKVRGLIAQRDLLRLQRDQLDKQVLGHRL